MLGSRDPLARKHPIEAWRHASPAPADHTERRLAALLHEIEKRPTAPIELPVASIRESDHSLRAYILTDALALIVSFLCAWGVATAVNLLFFGRHDLVAAREWTLPAVQSALLGASMLVWFGHSGHYQLRMPFWTEAKKVAEAAGMAFLIDCFLQVVSKQDHSRLWVIAGWGFSIVAILALRGAWRAFLRSRGLWNVPTLIVGDGPTAEDVRMALDAEPGLGYDVVAKAADELPGFNGVDGYSWAALCRAHGARHVIVALDGEAFAEARASLRQLMRERIPFSVAPSLHGLSVSGLMPQSFLGHDVMLMARNGGLDRPLSRFLKRGFDSTTSAAALIVLSPLIAILALIVRCDGGPALYRHRRIGLNGKRFTCLKFRSMVMDADAVLHAHLEADPAAREEWHHDHKLRDDPRVTRMGRFLRHTSLDELPQLFNVLRGDMSIVGPRPIIVAEAARYDHDIAFYYRVRPGITGLWQVSGRNDVSYAERVRMDSWYVRNWSLWNDIAIVCKTFAAVMRQDGAY
ncbi:MAG TPA: undecaprenyl-phosphate galactose phosphotransferase WbaP [Alphaproteobacteria bacterium]|nr:undecaprenyl-phosphate galactose phosphotransferase WbaP [Alphaproteobacteria bacterium]